MRRASVVLAAAAFCGCFVGGWAQGGLNDFSVYNFDRYGNGLEQNNNDLAGRLFVPSDYTPSQSYPIVMFLHGLGETGSNEYANYGTQNTTQVNGNIDNLLAAAKSRRFILYAPQAYSGWGGDMMDNAVNQLAKITTQYNVDKSRMYLTGLSLGGGGTIDTLGNYSHVFAAAVDICGSDNGIALQPAAVATVPLWIHHAQNDGTVNISVSRGRVNAIRNAKGLGSLTFPVAGNYVDDGTLRYTEYTSGNHGIWGSVYGQSAVYDWMLGNTSTGAQPKTHDIPKLQVGQKVLFDIGFNQVTSPVNGQTWNSTTYGLWSVVGPVKSYAKTSTGIGTSVTLSVTDTFAGEVNAASPAITADSWTVTSSNSGTIQLSGLDPNMLYDMELFGSTTSASSVTRYLVGGVFRDLDAYNNASSTVLLQNLTPDASGSLLLQVSAAPGSSNGYLNWMSLTSTSLVPEPTTMALVVPVLAGLSLRKRRRANAR